MKGLDCIAITDHNTLDGALHLAKISPFKVIVGEEVKTNEGEIVGLFLKKNIPPHMDLANTIEEIRSQGGIVYLPHPHKMDEESIIKNINSIEIIEVYNGRNLKTVYNNYALEVTRKYNKLMAAGSDSHTPFEIGRVYFEMEDFTSPEEFLRNLQGVKEFHYCYSLGNVFLNRVLLNNKIRKKLNKVIMKQNIRAKSRDE